MSISIVVSLDTRYKKKDDSFAIILRLGNGKDERTLSIPTGVSVPLKDWDDKKKEVKTSYKGVTSVARLNSLIDSKRKAARDMVLQLEENNQLERMSIMDIKKRITQSSQGNSFFAYADGLIAELSEAKRIGTKNAYKDAINALEAFHGSRQLDFKQITYDFLNRFENRHYAKGNTANGLAAYLRSIRAIYNKAIKSGTIDEKYYPFTKYKIGTVPTAKRALDSEPLYKIINLELNDDDDCFHVRNYFVASYMMYGMTYTDMAFLTKDKLIDGRVNYRRAKTSKLYDIKITASLKQIFSYYCNLNPESKYIFPIVKRETVEHQNKDIRWSRARYNKKLKKLATLCGIQSNLTSYVSRHSFATQAMYLDIPLPAISSMLGHSNLKTTQIYLQSLPSKTLDDYNAKILQG